MAKRPEILAPAGDRKSMEAAVRAGADAVYFGLSHFNARARAKNFDEATLAETIAYLHAHGVRGYVTLNTLVFDEELDRMRGAIEMVAHAGADAVIVQDLGVARLAREIAPSLPIHASTQMTCTDAAACELAKELGAKRVILARELSLDDIRALRAGTDVEIEVFVHGALCIAYSGQCLTSEAIGGRSANRGACAQACRLPYELVVDGVLRDLGDKAYLLSPEDLEASRMVPDLIAAGVCSLKIEGRLKGPEYVAATVTLYRQAIDAAMAGTGSDLAEARDLALQTFSRGSDVGFFGGVDHQRLVDGTTCDHRGVLVGAVVGTERQRGKLQVKVRLERRIVRGEGLLIQGGFAGEGEIGGRIWSIAVGGEEADAAEAGDEALVWLGPDRNLEGAVTGRRVFRTDAPKAEAAARQLEVAKIAIDVTAEGNLGEPLTLRAASERGHRAEIRSDALLEPAQKRGLDEALLRDKVGKLGDTPFTLGHLTVNVAPGAFISPTVLNDLRRRLAALLEQSVGGAHEVRPLAGAFASDRPLAAPSPTRGIFVLCRNLAQAEAAVAAGADGVGLDFLELTGTGQAVRALRAAGNVHITLAPPRIRKPAEEKIDRFLTALGPDAVLVRGLGALYEASHRAEATPFEAIGDFSLNVTNRIAAREVLGRGVSVFTPSFDLDGAQLLALLDDAELATRAEVVVHHPMPLFHMEHCVFAALLSTGKDHRTCGRPCDRHQLSLRDRAGMDHPVEADVGCRNTVFHARAQSAASLVPALVARGVARFRLEVVRETPDDVRRLVGVYRDLVAGKRTPIAVFPELRTEAGYGVVKGSLRVLA